MFARGDQSSPRSADDPGALAPGPTDAVTPPPQGAGAAPDLTAHSTDFVHQLRNRLFAMSALFDVLELRGAGSPAIDHYLPHLRLELGRLETFAEEWKEGSLAEAPSAGPGLTAVLAAAIERVSEHAALRDVRLSLATEPGAGRAVHHPTLVTAAFALLLDEVLRGAAAGSRAWFAVGRSARGETTVELHAPGAERLAGTGLELARATLRALGGDLVTDAASATGHATALAVVHLGAPS